MNNEILHITSKELQSMIDSKNVILVDVRTSEEVSKTKIDANNIIFIEYMQGENRALNPNFYIELESSLSQLDIKSIEKIVFICAAGRRSLMAISGYDNPHDLEVCNFSGGMTDWNNNEQYN